MAKKQAESTSTPENPLLKRVKDDVKEWKDYYDPYSKKHQDFWKLWNNKRVKRQYHGDSDSFDPMTHQMVETNVDNVYSSRPKMAFLPRNRYQETDTKILNGMWDRTWDDNNMDYYLPIMGREATITGNMVVFPSWEPDPDGPYMCITHIPIGDCILDGAATDQFHIRKAGYVFLARKDELQDQRRYDSEQDAWVPKYKNLDKVPLLGHDTQTDKTIKDMLTGSTLNTEGKKQQMAIVHMVYLDKIVEVANGTTVIYEEDNPYHRAAYEVDVHDQTPEGDKLYDETSIPPDAQTPEQIQAAAKPVTKKLTVRAIEAFVPIALHGGYKDGALLLAKGDVETFADTQEDLNDSINMNKDNIAYNVKNVAIADKTKVQPDEIQALSDAQPGSVVGVTGGAASVEWMEKPNMSQASLAEQERAKQSIRDTARIDEVVQGVSDQQQKTATEVKAQVAQASGGFNTKTVNLEAGFYRQLGETWIRFLQIFMPHDDQMVRVNGRDGIEFQLYNPSKYWGLYDAKPTLESNAKAKKEQDAQKALQAYELFRDSPNWNRYELDKYVAEKVFDMDDDQLKIMLNSSPDNAATMGGAAVGDTAGATGVQPPSATAVAAPGGQLHESADLVKLFVAASNRPQVQDQILNLLGFDPGQEPPLDVQQSAVDMAHKQMDMGMKLDQHQKSMSEPPKTVAGSGA